MNTKRPFFTLILLLTLSALVATVYGAEPSQPAEPGALTASMQAIIADRQPNLNISKATAATCSSGTASGYPCQNINLRSHIPLTSFSSSSGNDIWGWTDPQTNKEYALMGLNNGTAFVDISDPENPIYLGKLPTHTSNSSWRDIKVYANHAFIVSEATGHGMQIFDLTQLRNVTTPPVTFSHDAHYNSFGDAHNIVINEDSGYAYAVGANSCSRGLHIIDIRTPTGPTFAGCFSADGYTHDAQCVIYNGPDLEHIGKEICFNANEDTLTIVDVTNKSNTKQLSRTSYQIARYTHQGWLSEDQATFFLNDELDERQLGNNTQTYIWDVSDLDNPSQTNSYIGSSPNIDHNHYSKGGLLYQANYRAGLRILDATNPTSLSEVGYFDIFPSDNNSEFNGAWSNFPYFDSDLVVVSGMEQGLFVLEPTNMTPDFRLEPDDVTLAVCGTEADSLTFALDSLYGFNSNVSMSVSGVPAGANGSFAPASAPVSGNSSLTISNSSAALGDYLLTITATGGGQSYDEYVKLSVFAAATAVSTLSPTNHTVNLNWNDIGAASYELWQVSNNPYFEPSASCASSPACTTSSGTSAQINSGWGDPADNQTYLIVAPNTCGNVTTTIRHAVFNYSLTPGS